MASESTGTYEYLERAAKKAEACDATPTACPACDTSAAVYAQSDAAQDRLAAAQAEAIRALAVVRERLDCPCGHDRRDYE